MWSSRRWVRLGWIALPIGIAGFEIDLRLPGQPWLDVLVALEVALLAWLLSGRLRAWTRLFTIVVAASAAIVAVPRLHGLTTGIGYAIGGCFHLMAYAALLTWFALSLRRGHEPAVTGFARQMRTFMPINVLRYTRAVTWAWCVFFAAQLIVSLLLVTMTPYSTWSSFVSVWNLPLVVIMALGEYGVRSCLFSRSERTGFLATLVALREVRAFPSRQR